MTTLVVAEQKSSRSYDALTSLRRRPAVTTTVSRDCLASVNEAPTVRVG